MINDALATALELHRQGAITQAKDIYHNLLQDEPNNIEVLHLLGIINSQQKNYIAAEKYLIRALDLAPQTPELLNSMGNTQNNLGKRALAINYYQRAIEYRTEYFVAYNSLGNIYLAENNLTAAKENYLQAIKYKPDYIDAHYNLALVYAKENATDQAIAELNFVLELDENHLQAHHKRAEYAHIKQDFETAIYHYKQCLILDPMNIEAYHNLGAIFLAQNNPQAALKYYLRLLQFGADFDVYYNLGVIYSYQDHYKDAVMYFSQALELNTNDIRTLQNLGTLYIKLDDLPNARDYYQRAANIAPDNKEIKYILAALNNESSFSKAPEEYIIHLFDEYAPCFDQHLQQILDYNVPTLIKQAIETIIKSHNKLSILDLGCGTGLAGEQLKKYAKTLIGIDLSEKMLELAKQKNIYQHLEKIDILQALKKYNNQDLIVAADVLVYLGDLSTIFAQAKHALTNNGLFVFTIEKANIYPYTLNHSARYAHHKNYIDELIATNNFTIICCNNVILRKDKNKPIEGYLYILGTFSTPLLHA